MALPAHGVTPQSAGAGRGGGGCAVAAIAYVVYDTNRKGAIILSNDLITVIDRRVGAQMHSYLTPPCMKRMPAKIRWPSAALSINAAGPH